MPLIVIERSAGHWQDMARAYQVQVDGMSVGHVSAGQTLKVPVQPGQHGVRVSIDWCSSPEVQVTASEGDAATLRCSPNARLLLMGLYLTVWRRRYLKLEQVPA